MVNGKQMSLTEKAKINALAEQNVSNREITVKLVLMKVQCDAF